MKTLKDYISESIEEVMDADVLGYRTITLVKRSGIKVYDLSKEEFCSMFKEDYEKAVKEANALLDKEHEESKEQRVEKVRKEAEEYAMANYKRKGNREKYINNAVANELSKERSKWDDINRFDVDTSFGKENTSTVIEPNRIDGAILQVYRLLVEGDTDFYKEATGWSFKYICKNDTYKSSYRAWVDFDLSDSRKEEIKKNKEHLSKEIESFYKTAHYWGD